MNYMASKGFLSQGGGAFLETLRKQQSQIALSEKAQLETVEQLYDTISTRTNAAKEEAFTVRDYFLFACRKR